jgi:hypothetical protein
LQQRDLALPDRVDVGEAAVAELEADVEREVEVVVGERIGAVDRFPRCLDLDLRKRWTGATCALWLGMEQLADLPAQMADRAGKRGGQLLGPAGGVTRRAHRQNVGFPPVRELKPVVG